MEQRTINTPTERNKLKDASPDALVRLYLSAPSLKNFGIEFDILDPERIDGETRDSFIKRRTDEFAKAQSPIVLILSTETKESRNVAKVTCKRKEIIGMGEHPTVEEEYAFKKTYLGWKLIGVRKKAPKDADNSEF